MTFDHPSDVSKLYKSLPELIPQKVNGNGTSKHMLVEDYKEVLTALRAVEKAMGKANPHGRDYQTHSDPAASEKARMAWSCRRILISEMLTDIEHSTLMVFDQR